MLGPNGQRIYGRGHAYRVARGPSGALVTVRWRAEDAHRNALSAHCYWLLRKQGLSPSVAEGRIFGLSVADKNELLFQHGVNFNNLPAWQRRGVGLVWEQYDKPGFNPQTGLPVSAARRRLALVEELPVGDAYAAWLAALLDRVGEP